MQREPGLDRVVVVVRIEGAGLPRRTKSSGRAVDFVGQAQLLPRHDFPAVRHGDQRTGALGELWVFGKEGVVSENGK